MKLPSKRRILVISALGAGLRASLSRGGPKNVSKAIGREGRRLVGKLVMSLLAGGVVGIGIGLAAGSLPVGIFVGMGTAFLTLVVLLLV